MSASSTKSSASFVNRAYKKIVAGSPFSARLERELSVDASASASVSSSDKASGLREKRDEVHRAALQALPYGWLRSNLTFIL